MAGQRARRKPAFQAQATLIVLPLLVLVAVGIWSLRQDRLFAEQEARDDSRQLAEKVLPELVEAIVRARSDLLDSAHARVSSSNTAFSGVLFQVSQTGRLLKPSPMANPLPKPLEAAELDPGLADIWQAARRAEFRDGATDTALTGYRMFLDQSPPDDFAASARMSVALLEAQRGRQQESVEQLRTVINGSPGTLLESGLPAQAVAALKLVEVAVDPAGNEIPWVDLLGTVCSNAVERPSWVTPPLLQVVALRADELERPALKDWLSLWIQHELARSLYKEARHHFRPAGLSTHIGPMSDPQVTDPVHGPTGSTTPASSDPLWIASHDVAWLVLPEAAVPDRWMACIPEKALAREFDTVWRGNSNVPAYFGAGVTVGSRQYRLSPNGVAGQWLQNEMAIRGASVFPHSQAYRRTADRAPSADDGIKLAAHSTTDPVLGVLELAIFLDNPSLLFARQRTRTYWFAALIVVSATAAFIGLVSAWRAFHRQQLLVEMRSQFVSSVSHELRAPIASIRLLAEGLELGRVRAADKQAEYFSLMGQECRRLTALIENVLDFSRIDQGRKQFEFEPTDVGALVRQTVRLMEPQATERQVMLAVDFREADHGPPTTDHGTTEVCPQPSLDGRAIQQALVNLIDNAIKHAPPKSSVEVGLAFEPPAREPTRDPIPNQADRTTPFRIWVRDCGEGIPSTDHERIFEPFYRRGTELRRETIGIGIGLSIVRHIIEAHGGRVSVESEPGHGSKFTLHIP
jgi:signal transduction histidine kinase